MQKTKRQHYVPRLLLRNFTTNGKTVQMYVVETGMFIENAGIKEQCYEDHFYGEDGSLEKSFGKLESDFGGILQGLSKERLNSLSENELTTIRMFVHYQSHRTVQSAEHMNMLADRMMKALVKDHPELGKMDLEKYELRLDAPQHWILYAAAQTVPVVGDLELKFLLNDRENHFLISDHPVVQYNQFIEHHKVLKMHPGATGLATRGLQLFLPVSPSVCIHLYDPSCYSVGKGEDRFVGLSKRDVEVLNRLQIINSHECIYFLDRLRLGIDIDKELVARKPAKKASEPNTSFETLRHQDGSKNPIVIMQSDDVRLGNKFSFAQVVDHGSYDSYTNASLPVRSHERIDLMRQYSKFLDDLVEGKRDGRNKGDETGSEE